MVIVQLTLSFLTAYGRKHIFFAATRRTRLGDVPPRTPPNTPRASGGFSTVRNIKSAASLAHGASTCAFDLLTGLSIRTVHWTVLISGPPVPRLCFYRFYIAPLNRRPWRYIDAPPTSCRREGHVLIMTACGRMLNISRAYYANIDKYWAK